MSFLNQINSFENINFSNEGFGREKEGRLQKSEKRKKADEGYSLFLNKRKKDSNKVSPFIAIGKFYFDKSEYSVKKIGAGKEHFVYSFSEKRTITINEKKLDTTKIVLKSYNPQNIDPKSKKGSRDVTMELAAYKHLSKNGIPIPQVHATPETFKNEKGELIQAWVVEKMASEIDLTDKKIIEFAKKYLTENAKRTADDDLFFVSDFRPDNVMRDIEGQLKVVDFAKQEESDVWTLNQHVKAWANGDENVFNELIADFPKEIKKSMIRDSEFLE